jgi:predicted Zn-dependent protease
MLGKEKLFDKLNSIIKKIDAVDEVEIFYTGGVNSLFRLANTNIIQKSLETNGTVVIRVAKNNSIGKVVVNSLEDEEIKDAFSRAIELANQAKPNKFFKGFTQKSNLNKEININTALFIKEKIEHIGKIFKEAQTKDIKIAGKYNTITREMAYVNSHEVALYWPWNVCELKVFPIFNGKVSGYSWYYGRDFHEIDINQIINEAMHLPVSDNNPCEIPLGKYNVILGPAAVSEIMEWFIEISFNSKSFLDQESFLFGNLDRKLMGENVTIYDDSVNNAGIPMPFDCEGVIKKPVYFLKNGVAFNMVYNKKDALKVNMESTGHANSEIPYALPTNLFIKEGYHALEDMLKQVHNGIYITKLHYINGLLDVKKAKMTGLTREGAFLIENGKLTKPITTMRFTENMVEAFNRIKMISRERRSAPLFWMDQGCITVPYLLIEDFNFTGKQVLF